jgi:hypothetical protein
MSRCYVMGTLKGFAPPFGPAPATASPLASPFGDFGTCTFPTTPARCARALALGLAMPFGPPPATPTPLASPFGDFGTCTFPTTPARYARTLALGLAMPSRDGAPPA